MWFIKRVYTLSTNSSFPTKIKYSILLYGYNNSGLCFWKIQEWKLTAKDQKGRRNSRGTMRVKVFTFRSYKLTHAERSRHNTYTHTQSSIHACWSNHRAWHRMTIWGLHCHQNKSNPKDPSSHLDRQPSQLIRSGAADCWIQYRYPEFRLLGWIPIVILLNPLSLDWAE